ncbi:hypothetical protein Tco_0268354 [Tanacetum coccineum]
MNLSMDVGGLVRERCTGLHDIAMADMRVAEQRYFVVVEAKILKAVSTSTLKFYTRNCYPSRSAIPSIKASSKNQQSANAVSSKPESFDTRTSVDCKIFHQVKELKRNSNPCCDESVFSAENNILSFGSRVQVVIILRPFVLRTRPEETFSTYISCRCGARSMSLLLIDPRMTTMHLNPELVFACMNMSKHLISGEFEKGVVFPKTDVLEFGDHVGSQNNRWIIKTRGSKYHMGSHDKQGLIRDAFLRNLGLAKVSVPLYVAQLGAKDLNV